MKEVTHQQFLDALYVVRLYARQVSDHLKEVRSGMDIVSRYIGVGENTKVSEIPFSRRTLNVLKQVEGLDFEGGTVKDLEKVSLARLRDQKNAGRRTLYELEEFFLYAGIKPLP